MKYKILVIFGILIISSKKSPTSISRGWIAFLFSWNCFKNTIQLNHLKVIKKEYFWSRSFFVLSIGGASKEEEMKIIKRAYKFRIYPTLEQISFFAKSFGCVRKV